MQNIFKKLDKIRVFRDPLYGYIEVEYEIIAKLIDSDEVQRLRRIRQLSGVSMVFQTAEHSRFCHALGAYQMAVLVNRTVTGIKENLSEYEQLLFLIAALLHDVGHGPYSHAFEHVMSVKHEKMTANIILAKETKINQILGESLALDVASIILKEGKYPLVEKLVSSELDVDRMDYLSRDAYFTGATYGTIDRNRLLRCMVIKDKNIYVKASGVHTVESYLMSRYHMYFQVYYHPVARGYDLILEKIYQRIIDLYNEGKDVDAYASSLIKVLKTNDILEYINLDDAYVNGMVKSLRNSDDYVLKTLSRAFLNRKLFKYQEILTDNNLVKVKNDYFYDESAVSAVMYLGKGIDNIYILSPDNSIKKLEDFSPIVNSLMKSSYKMVKRIYYFEDNSDETTNSR